MKASARNQFVGNVSAVQMGAVNAEVHINLSGGQALIAAITKDSVEALGIKKGMEIMALIKAPHVILVTDFGGYTLSARNQLLGTIKRVKLGAVNAEVELALQGGEVIVTTVTNESVDSLGLQVGVAVTAVFKASAVMLAVKA